MKIEKITISREEFVKKCAETVSDMIDEAAEEVKEKKGNVAATALAITLMGMKLTSRIAKELFGDPDAE